MASLPKTTRQTKADLLTRLAFDAGLPTDSLARFERYLYLPQPRQIAFHGAARSCDFTETDYVGFGGARGPGKSHAVFAQIALDDCQRIPNLKVLYLRKISKNAREQFEDLRRSVLFACPHEYNRSTGVLSFPNNSRIVLGHFRTEGDIDQYLGLEYDVICIEEATTLTKSKWDALRDSNRTSKPNFRPRIYASTNPGGVGHVWFKKMFIEPARTGTETNTRFVFATVDDNKFIDAGYTKKLEENAGWRLRAYRFGDWDIAAGQYFSTFDYTRHVVEPFRLANAVWLAALDYGFTHPTACYLLAKWDGKVYVVDEHYEAKKLPLWHSVEIKRMLARNNLKIHNLKTFVAGHDVFAQKGDEKAKTIADQYAEYDIKLKPAAVDRISGASLILEMLGDENTPQELFIFNRCKRLIETLPALQHNPNRPEDVLKIDADENGDNGDDAYDALRYGLMACERRKAATLRGF